MKYLIPCIAILSLVGCGQSGNLYLKEAYIKKHQTHQQKTAPSKSLKPLQDNQRILHDS